MHFEERKHYSSHLNRNMVFNRYGHTGKPVIAFPSSGGSHTEYADFQMVKTLDAFIEHGMIQIFTPESNDRESWLHPKKNPHDKAQAHNRYDRYIISEFIPAVKHITGWMEPMIATGCSLGGYHALNFGLRHPDVFDTVIAQSGIYDLSYLVGDYGDDFVVYENSPLDYLGGMEDSWFLEKYRQNDYAIVVGQGNWEYPHLDQTRDLEQLFEEKNIPAWFDYWGHDADHDWSWWRHQIYYFFNELRLQDKLPESTLTH